MAENVRIFLRITGHSVTPTDCQNATYDFMKSDLFFEKLRCMLCNTNNGTEKLNEDLKYNNLT